MTRQAGRREVVVAGGSDDFLSQVVDVGSGSTRPPPEVAGGAPTEESGPAARLSQDTRTAVFGMELADADVLEGLPPELVDMGLVARGGMGEVRVVREMPLDRIVAAKVSTRIHASGDHALALAEARLTAALQHPNIMFVHACGVLPDGRVWFTMPLQLGGTLLGHIHEVHLASTDGTWATTKDDWTLRRLVAAFEGVCQGVAYAHAKNVIHRDLKPANVVTGSFGEVQVIDWGLATEQQELDGRRIMGTPGYMPPEQASGREDQHGPHSDVFSLGATLFAILAGTPPWPDVHAVLTAPRARFPASPQVPPELAALCDRALSWDPADRGTAADLARGVRAWLDGARRRDEATVILEDALVLPGRSRATRERAEALREEAAAMLEPVKPWAPEEEKAPAWEKQDRAAALDAEAVLDELRYVEALQAALKVDPTFAEAEMRLAEHYRDELVRAEGRNDKEGEARAEFLLRNHDKARQFGAWLEPEGAFTLVTDPPGATVTVERYELYNRRLVPREIGLVGVTPIVEMRLPIGSYRLRVDYPGRRTVLYPIVLRRNQHWDGVPPEGGDPFVIEIPTDLEEDDCYVPAGWFTAYGDPEAADPLPARLIWVDGFVIKKYPVTVGEYFEFLNEIARSDGIDAALELAPRVDSPSSADTNVLCRRDDLGVLRPSSIKGTTPWHTDWPVTYINWHAARRFATSISTHWDLPHSLEREKASRGVDGRFFPWGNFLDSTYANNIDSTPGPPERAAVGAFPSDRGPYEVGGTAGNSRDWCRDQYVAQGNPRGRLLVNDTIPTIATARGGAWNVKGIWTRLAGRYGNSTGRREAGLGARLVRPLGDSTQ